MFLASYCYIRKPEIVLPIIPLQTVMLTILQLTGKSKSVMESSNEPADFMRLQLRLTPYESDSILS